MENTFSPRHAKHVVFYWYHVYHFGISNNRMQQMTTQPEFSRLIAIDGIIPDKPRLERVEASVEECAALAKRFDLKSLSGLKAKLTILRVSDGNIIRIEGDIEAEVVQTCVVSLQGVSSEINGHFDTYFTEDGKEGFDEAEQLSVEVDDEVPDMVINGGMLDLGELTSQYLSLELDPYPRAPGVSLAAQLSEIGADTKNRPFQILKKLKTEEDE
jgi:uncharacterized metal-binding protein YceD (DUF177 family)